MKKVLKKVKRTMNLSKKERKCSKKVVKFTVDCVNCKKVLKFTADCGFSKKVLKSSKNR